MIRFENKRPFSIQAAPPTAAGNAGRKKERHRQSDINVT
jgi:hypothetical protein